MLKDNVEHIEVNCEKQIDDIKEQIEKCREENKYLYDLLNETDDVLVKAVIEALNVLGFSQVIDVDEESRRNGTEASLKEDIQIKDVSPILVVDVKGITGLPSDAEATQAHRHATMRMKEWGRTDINCLTIINHQRNIPSLDRENNKPYRQEQLDSASQIDLGLMTTWDLYRLLRSFLRNKWEPENVKPLFYKSKRISIIPENYNYIGVVKNIWPNPQAFGVLLEKGSLDKGDIIGFETPVEIVEYEVISLQIEEEDVQHAEAGVEVGIKTTEFSSLLKKGYKIYKRKK